MATARSDIYQQDVNIADKNNPRSIVCDYVHDGAYILDVGCACGDLGVALKRYKHATVVGMEYNTESISLALTKNAYSKIYQLDLNNFDIKNFEQYYGKFDYIVFGDVLEHLLNPKEVLEKFTIFLKENGRFLISFPNIAHASIKMSLLTNDWTYTDAGLLDETHIRFFTYKTIAKFLAELGLQIIEVNYTSIGRAGHQPGRPWKKIFRPLLIFIYKDPHSFVMQYVLNIAKTSVFCNIMNLHDHNLSKLQIRWSTMTKAMKRNIWKSSYFMRPYLGWLFLRAKILGDNLIE